MLERFNVRSALISVIARLDRVIQAVMEKKIDVGIWIPWSRRGMAVFWYVVWQFKGWNVMTQGISLC